MILKMFVLFCLAFSAISQDKVQDQGNNSIANRSNKKFSALLGGEFVNGLSTTTFSLGYYFKPNIVAEIKLNYGLDYSRETFAQGPQEDLEKMLMLSLGAKFFVGNSFYVKSSLSYIDETDGVSGGFIFVTTKERDELEGLGLSFSIGNQWQFDNFTIGCDWIGINQVFAKFRDDGNSEMAIISLLGFSIGASF